MNPKLFRWEEIAKTGYLTWVLPHGAKTPLFFRLWRFWVLLETWLHHVYNDP